MLKKNTLLQLLILIPAFLSASNICSAADLKLAQQNIFSLMDAGDYAGAESQVNQMMDEFSGDKDTPVAIYWIVRRYEWSSRFEEANRIYEKIIRAYPKSSYASQAQIGIARIDAISFIMSQDYDHAEQSIDKLVADFHQHPDFPETLYLIAERYEWLNKFDEEKNIYYRTVNKYPRSLDINNIRLAIARADVLSLIYSQRHSDAQTAIDKLFVDFAGCPDLPMVVTIAGEKYYKEGLSNEKEGRVRLAKGYFEKAVKIWDKLIDEIPDFPSIPEVYCWAGDCYHKLGKYEESLKHFQKVVDNHPQYEYAWHALSMVGINYEKMKDSGIISESDANPKIKAAYTQIIQKYPNCPKVSEARAWLLTNAGSR